MVSGWQQEAALTCIAREISELNLSIRPFPSDCPCRKGMEPYSMPNWMACTPGVCRVL